MKIMNSNELELERKSESEIDKEMNELAQPAQKIIDWVEEIKERKSKDKEIIEQEVNWNEAIPYEEFEMKVGHLDEDKKKIIYDLVDSTRFSR